MISYGRWGEVGGKKCFFTHVNPKNNMVWSDDLMGSKPDPIRPYRMIACAGAWIGKDKVKWI